MARDIFIHAGSHRAGSSALQMFLDVNAAAIRAQGIDPVYPGRDGAAGGAFRFRVPAPRDKAGKVKARFDITQGSFERMAPGSGPVILSEENIPGRMRPLFQGRFFPEADHRAGFLARVLGPNRVARLTLVLRPYDELFTSAYRKLAATRRLPPFAGLAPKMLDSPIGWPEVVAKLAEALRPGEIRVLRYCPRPQAEIAAAICPLLDTGPLVEHAAPVNASLPDAALFALQARYGAGAEPGEALIAEVRAETEGRAAPEPFAGFNENGRAKLRARFEDDLARLAKMPGVTVEG